MCTGVPRTSICSGFTSAPIGGIMRDGKCPTDKARGRAEVRQLRSPVSGWEAVAGFYWDDISSRRLRPEQMTGKEALEQARAFARAARYRR